MSDKELAQLRRSSRVSANELCLVVEEQKKRGLVKENFSGFGYAPEIVKNISDYIEKLNVDEEMEWNIMSLDNGTMVDVPEEMRACNVKEPSEIESILKSKIEIAVERTDNNRDLCHLISLIMDSAVKQRLIQAWRGFRSEINKELIYEVQVSYPILAPRLYVSAPLLDKEW